MNFSFLINIDIQFNQQENELILKPNKLKLNILGLLI